MALFRFITLFLILAFGTYFSDSYSMEKCKSSDLCLGTEDKKCGRLTDKLEYLVELKNIVTNGTTIYPFCISVDRFSRVTLSESYNWMTSDGRQVKDTRIIVRAGKLHSIGNKIYSDGTKFATSLTTILQFGAYGLSSGVLQGIDWDNTCSNGRCMFDYSNNCIGDIDCSANINDIQDDNENSGKDVSIFIGFRGSDKYGNLCVSANELPKTYRALSFSFTAVQFYDKARKVFPFKI